MYDESKVMFGEGEAWLDGEYIAEIIGCSAKVDITLEKIPSRKPGGAFKMNGWEGKGSLTVNKANSRFLLACIDMLKTNKSKTFTIITKLADADAGTERVALKGVMFNDLTLANWKLKTQTEIEVPFIFTDCDGYDFINP